ncbi:MAG: hypothetical protein AB1648_05175 [Pseudomonadota bacterium]
MSSINEQFLQNIVRLHYRDPTFFLDVSNVAATMKLDLSGGLDQTTLGLNGASSANNILKFSAGAAYSTQPTISYTPLQGESFVKSVLSPIPIEAVFALAGSGWSARRVFSLCVERINGIENAPTASGPTPDRSPDRSRRFEELLQLMEDIAGEGLVAPNVNPETKEIQLEFMPSPEHAGTIRAIKQMLGLDPDLEFYRVNGDFLTHRPDTIAIRTRTLMGIFFYMSHRVDTPQDHKAAGLVTITRNKDGSEFDWSDTPGGRLFHLSESESQPDQAFLAVPYRGRWFYLADNDLESKSTFMLLSQLFRLQAGAAKPVGPMLTIPVR